MQNSPFIIVFVLIVQCLTLPKADCVYAEDASIEFFEKNIRPALVKHCIRCHGPEKVQGGLRLDSREACSQTYQHVMAPRPCKER